MPLKPELDGIEGRTDLSTTFAAMGEMMLPAVVAMQAYHPLGLAHQDVHVTNVAVDRTTGRAIPYDNSLVAKLGDCAEV